ncbi:MAG: hypothetical protein AAGH60_14620 [Pseudomonadota bacterium]
MTRNSLQLGAAFMAAFFMPGVSQAQSFCASHEIIMSMAGERYQQLVRGRGIDVGGANG